MVTITGSLGALAAGTTTTPGLGVTGRLGTVELVPKHPSGTPASYPVFGQVVLSQVQPVVLTLSGGGGIPANTVVLASAALFPAGCFYRVTWRTGATPTTEAEEITYDCYVGPDGGTCDLANPANRIDAGTRPVFAGWPEVPPLVVYTSEGSS